MPAGFGGVRGVSSVAEALAGKCSLKNWIRKAVSRRLSAISQRQTAKRGTAIAVRAFFAARVCAPGALRLQPARPALPLRAEVISTLADS
jgi:hypothetical protein